MDTVDVSNSYHGSEIELRDALEELYVEHGVDLVIAGHDHSDSPVSSESVMDKGMDDKFGRGHGPIHLVIGIAGRLPTRNWMNLNPNGVLLERIAPMDGLDGYMMEKREITMTHHRIDEQSGISLLFRKLHFSRIRR